MVAFGIWLASVGIGDAIADLSGIVPNRTRASLGWAAAIGTSLLLTISAGFALVPTFALLMITGATHAGWLWARRPAEWSPIRGATLFLAAILAILAMLAFSPVWTVPEGGTLARWLDAVSVDRVSIETFCVGFGALLFLQSSANAIVRALLAWVGTPPAAEEQLRGGRVIGPLERTLIFSLAVAGQPTAAALVISAKGILRFPEISKEEKSHIHVVTEYFLVGSLSSWVLALAGAGLLVI